MSSTFESVSSFLEPYAERPMLVAFSGGVDSTVLLHLLVTLRDQSLLSDLTAVHIHHGLSRHADQWAEHCRQICDKWSVPLHIEKVYVGSGAGDGIEQEARKQRYRVFSQQLPSGGCLLQGHHQDDQAETLLFRLFRGSGMAGLAGIPESRVLGEGLLLRPLLKISRQAIEDYALFHGLSHVEDESNLDVQFTRNYLRHSLIPEIDKRWPGVSGRLAALAAEVSDVNHRIQQLVGLDAREIIVDPPARIWGQQPVIDLAQLAQLPKQDGARVIRHWLGSLGVIMPGRDMVQRIFSELIEAREDAEPVIRWPGCELRRFNGFLAFVQPNDVKTSDSVLWDWQNSPKLDLAGGGSLVIEQADGDSDRDSGVLLPPGPVEVCFRVGLPAGEKIRIAGRSGSKKVKRWLQDYRVPPWLRDSVPFLYHDGKMLAAPGLWVCEGYLADTRESLRIDWQPASEDRL